MVHPTPSYWENRKSYTKDFIDFAIKPMETLFFCTTSQTAIIIFI